MAGLDTEIHKRSQTKLVNTTATAAVIGTSVTTALFTHKDAKKPVVIEHMMAMEAIGVGMNSLVGMAKGAIAFDAAKADAVFATLSEEGALVPAMFEANETDPTTEALPAIWENYADLIQKSEDMVCVVKNVGPIADQAALGAALG